MEILQAVHKNNLDAFIGQAVCANVYRTQNLMSQSEAGKIANVLITKTLSIGLDVYVELFLKHEYHGKERLYEILHYIYRRWYDLNNKEVIKPIRR